MTLYPTAEIAGPVTNLKDLAREMLAQSRYDVIYCDVQLADGDCFSVLADVEVTTPIVFTTGYAQYANEAFHVDGIDYLLKPIKPELLRKATAKALSLGKHWRDKIAPSGDLQKGECKGCLHFLKDQVYDGLRIIDLSHVILFETGKGYAHVLMDDGTTRRVNYSLAQLMRRLDTREFFRANRQYIVSRHAIQHVRTYGNRQMRLMLTGHEVKKVIISKERVAEFNHWIEQ